MEASWRDRAFVPVVLYTGGCAGIISSLGAPLIPMLAQRLHVSLSAAQWSLTATLVVGAVASPLLGRLGDGRHRKSTILGCLLLVVLGCIMAAVATSLAVLVIGRALQGLGIALTPLTMSAARERLAPERARRTIAALSVIGAAGVGLGYPVTGLIANELDVSAAYWVGAGASVVALLLCVAVFPRPKLQTDTGRLDIPGAAIISIGLVGVLIAADKGPDWGWGSTDTLSLMAAGFLLLIAWGFYELRVPRPLVELRLVRHPAVLGANLAGLCLGISLYLNLVTVVQFVQLPGVGLGQSVFVSGLVLLPFAVGSAVASRTVPWLEHRIGMRAVVAVGSASVGAAALLFGLAPSGLGVAFGAMGFVGIGIGYTFAALPSLVVGNVPAHETGSALGFYQVSRFVGIALGSGIAVTLLRIFGDDGELTRAAFHHTAFVGLGTSLLAALIAWFMLRPRRGASIRTDPELEERASREGLLASAGLESLEEDPLVADATPSGDGVGRSVGR